MEKGDLTAYPEQTFFMASWSQLLIFRLQVTQIVFFEPIRSEKMLKICALDSDLYRLFLMKEDNCLEMCLDCGQLFCGSVAHRIYGR